MDSTSNNKYRVLTSSLVSVFVVPQYFLLAVKETLIHQADIKPVDLLVSVTHTFVIFYHMIVFTCE